MQDSQLNHISNLIWSVANDVLRDLYVRGKYRRDVILPMTVLRRLDAVLKPTKKAVLNCKKLLDDAGILEQDGPLQDAAGQAFYNPRLSLCATCAPAPRRNSSALTLQPT